ncbi:MAG: hypothetical protein ABJA67_17285 [Chthonomonadales bacterium]
MKLLSSISVAFALSVCMNNSFAQAPKAQSAVKTSSWTNVTHNVGGEKWGYAGVTMIASPPGSSEIIAGVSEAGLWHSMDGGANWEQLGQAGQITNRPYQIAFSTKDPKTFWISGSYGPGVFKTTNGGRSFVKLGNLQHTDGISVDPTDEFGRSLIVGMHEQGRLLSVSTSSGLSWRQIGEGLPATSGNANNVLIVNDKVLLVGVSRYGGATTTGIYLSGDGGSTFRKVNGENPMGLPVLSSDGTIFWPLESGLLRSTTQGSTWELIKVPCHGMVAEINNKRLVCINGNQLYLSENRGTTWAPIGPPIPVVPNSLAWCEGLKAVIVSKMTDTKSPNAIFRLNIN